MQPIMKPIVLFLIFYIINDVKADETYENSTNICQRCKCQTTGKVFNLDCSRTRMEHVLAEWPKHNNKTLRATFSFNYMSVLGSLPPSDSAVEVVLSNCQIKLLHDGLFKNMEKVQLIDLSYNLLTAEQMTKDKFRGPYNNISFDTIGVKTLNLAYNKIHSLPSQFFAYMPNLKTLNLEGNHFRVLDIHTQTALASLQLNYLNLANNELTELIPGAIDEYKNLIELNLGRNEIEVFPDSLKNVAGSLEVLVMDDNPISELTDETFLGFSLVELSLNNLTGLQSIMAHTFRPLKRLQKLSLSRNKKLIIIDAEALSNVTTIQELYINDSGLEDIDDTLLAWSNLKILEFSGNPLRCTCNLYNIVSQLNNDTIRSKEGPICVDPHLTSRQVYELTEEICSMEPLIFGSQRLTKHFTILRISLIAVSLILTICTFIAIGLAYTKYRKHGPPNLSQITSNVVYNRIVNDPRV